VSGYVTRGFLPWNKSAVPGRGIFIADKWTELDIPDQKRRVAVVTGANSGLGFETVLAQPGASVALAVRG